MVSRETLAREVWQERGRTPTLDNVIDVHVARLGRRSTPRPGEADSHRARRRIRGSGGGGMKALAASARRSRAADAVVRRRDGGRAHRLRGGRVRLRQAQRVGRRSTRACASDFSWAAEMWDQQSGRHASPGSMPTSTPLRTRTTRGCRCGSPQGELLFQTSVARRNPLRPGAALAAQPESTSSRWTTAAPTFRVLSRPEQVGGKPVVIQVARSDGTMRQESAQS